MISAIFELKAASGINFRIGLGVASKREDPTAAAAPDDIIAIARSLVWSGR
ncbi:hypothetical protein [Rhizobium ruizarguesonis]|uniref:hypothetical protein n=1 Tax=Rhizobium ruizarguesonis TaxID=2081791 RepID=UPI0013DEDD3E|nr:hypothetical protein [Rhizobium ruizarguesonis]NEJ98658.1 hypothetical protein [Rhizobium ruizarguesonis]